MIITEQGCADLRGLTAYERARALIENCAHPKFRPALQAFVERRAARPGFRHGFAPEDPQRWMQDYRPEENESEKGND